MENTSNDIIEQIAEKEYEYGFVTDIEMEIAPPGFDENIILFISKNCSFKILRGHSARNITSRGKSKYIRRENRNNL